MHVVWGEQDRVARARTSRHGDQLPPHARIETWLGCGHVSVWDAPERVVAAAVALPTSYDAAGRAHGTGRRSA